MFEFPGQPQHQVRVVARIQERDGARRLRRFKRGKTGRFRILQRLQ